MLHKLLRKNSIRAIVTEKQIDQLEINREVREKARKVRKY